MEHPLTNPVWSALCSSQSRFNIGSHNVKFFPSDVSPFIGLERWDDADRLALIDQLPHNRNFSVMIAKPVDLPTGVETIFTIPLFQMICTSGSTINTNKGEVRLLTDADIPAMLSLTGRTKPGPFFQRTIEMGRYFGLFDRDKLVSMAGERLQLPGYTEVSAICTDPDHHGKGYASLLTSIVCEKIIEEGNMPFLHVRFDNTRAIEVYKKLGFEIRADVFFAIFKRL